MAPAQTGPRRLGKRRWREEMGGHRHQPALGPGGSAATSYQATLNQCRPWRAGHPPTPLLASTALQAQNQTSTPAELPTTAQGVCPRDMDVRARGHLHRHREGRRRLWNSESCLDKSPQVRKDPAQDSGGRGRPATAHAVLGGKGQGRSSKTWARPLAWSVAAQGLHLWGPRWPAWPLHQARGGRRGVQAGEQESTCQSAVLRGLGTAPSPLEQVGDLSSDAKQRAEARGAPTCR